jgi:formylglycine-generating enzyme required for sulfatase activity
MRIVLVAILMLSVSPACKKQPSNHTLQAKTTAAAVESAPSSPSSIQSKATTPMVLVPAGPFLRGAKEDTSGRRNDSRKPQRSIYLDAFYIDRHEVTVAQYRRCVGRKRCSYTVRPPVNNTAPRSHVIHPSHGACNWGLAGREKHPINCVDWFQAQAYCGWVGKRLPTEAEWEKAARGTDGRKFPWGNAPPTCQRVAIQGEGCGEGLKWPATSPVGTRSPAGDSPYGVQDMSGNVGEWTADWFANKYSSSAQQNPRGPKTGTKRTTRGGSWVYVSWDHLRATHRARSHPRSCGGRLGFRCAKSIK